MPQPVPSPTATLSPPSPLLPAAQPCRRRAPSHRLCHLAAPSRSSSVLPYHLLLSSALLAVKRQPISSHQRIPLSFVLKRSSQRHNYRFSCQRSSCLLAPSTFPVTT
ncbi:hypothetical protein BHM03_00031019 [Ensete ventricosum]|nr:hypothetical protein BHM03_00031019 [Ensete ventricosum]